MKIFFAIFSITYKKNLLYQIKHISLHKKMFNKHIKYLKCLTEIFILPQSGLSNK
jgi:hypothetical protein